MILCSLFFKKLLAIYHTNTQEYANLRNGVQVFSQISRIPTWYENFEQEGVAYSVYGMLFLKNKEQPIENLFLR